MLINIDAKALEWVCAVYLSGDTVGRSEIERGIDQHSSNQRAFELPSRLVAKTFVFRLLYGGSAYAYANDSDFTHVSVSEEYWQSVIDKFYAKYQGISKWHSSLVETVGKDGKLLMPTGREYRFLMKSGKGGESKIPRTQVLNYPVQGLGADLMAIIRVSLSRRLRKLGIVYKLVCSVHDSVLIDTPKENVALISKTVYSVFDDMPRNFEKMFGVPFTLPLGVEIQIGKDWGNMIEFTKDMI